MAMQAEDQDSQASVAQQTAPTLSVTVLNYNYARYLPECLDSILKQTFADFELIVINDCSTDNSLEVIEPYLADPRVRLVNHGQNKGYIASLIEGSQISRGKYITVISADDFCVSNRAFENLVRPMEADGEAVFAYSAHGQYADDGTRVYLRRPHLESFVRAGYEEYRDIVQENYILHSGVIIRSTAYAAVGGYDPTARYACDTILWLMLCAQGKVVYSADELYAYRRHDSNMSVSTNGIRGGLQEHLRGIDESFVVMRGKPNITDALHVQAIKKNLTAPALDNIFSNRPLAAWYAYWCGLRMHPLLTLFQSRTLILILRTVLGPEQFGAVRSVLRRGRPSVSPA